MTRLTPDEDSDEDFVLIGKIVLWWGHVESRLAGLILRLFHPHNRYHFKKFVGVPVNFDDRVKRAVEGFATIPKFAPLRESAIQTLESLRPLHETRTVIVHGYFQGRTVNDVFLFDLYKSKRRDRVPGSYSFEFPRSQLEQLVEDLKSADEAMRQLSSATFRL